MGWAPPWAPGWEVLVGHPGKEQPEQGRQEESPVRTGESEPRVLGGSFPTVAPGPHLSAPNHCLVAGQTHTLIQATRQLLLTRQPALLTPG